MIKVMTKYKSAYMSGLRGTPTLIYKITKETPPPPPPRRVTI